MESLEHFFTANGITQVDKKRAVLLIVIGGVVKHFIASEVRREDVCRARGGAFETLQTDPVGDR